MKYISVLVTIVVVGGVVLGSLCYVDSDSIQISFLGDSLVDRETADCLSVDDLMANLNESEAALTQGYEAVSASRDFDLESMDGLLDVVRCSYEELGQQDDVPPQVLAEARMLRLSSFFVAAQLNKEQYAKEFDQITLQMTENPADANEAAKASILRFCNQQQFDRPFTDQQHQEMVALTDSFNRHGQGLALYSIVAHELWKHGQKESAESVLEYGIEKFEGKPGRTKLVHQLVDQGHRAPPKPRMTQKQFNAMMARAERLAGSRGAASCRTVKG